jgi:3'-phosphoadenosine 5'-phosphosulfate sulfotransferase (PAPS reductase)/FAD synthetase
MKAISINSNLDYKICLAQNIIIEEYMRTNGNLFLSWSGGKDSTVLMHIAKNLFPDIKIVFSDTTNEMSEIKKYIKQFSNVIIVKPRISFKKVIKLHGFPLVSKEISQKANELKHSNGKRTKLLRYYGDKKGNSVLPKKWRFLAEQKFDVTNKCCYILKKEPLERWAKANGNPKPLIALMSDESRLRQQLALYGNENGKKVYPFLRTGWTEKDIWAYAKKYNIRFAECYYDSVVNGVLIKALDRSGCEYCNFGVHLDKNDKFERSRALAPKRYENMMKIENNGVTFQEAINLVKNRDRSKICVKQVK